MLAAAVVARLPHPSAGPVSAAATALTTRDTEPADDTDYDTLLRRLRERGDLHNDGMLATDCPMLDTFKRIWRARANAARTGIEEDRAMPDPNSPAVLAYITHVPWTPFEPSPAMDSSYYLEDLDAAAQNPHELPGSSNVARSHLTGALLADFSNPKELLLPEA